jgi:hypothetical protein
MNGPAVFLSYARTDEVAVDIIEQALRSRGLAVFRDKGIHLFDGVTSTVRRALDSSIVLLAFYSRRYPVRYASQWELTRALLAARKLGGPGGRVLIVNPEPDDRHIVPIDFTDAGCFSWRNESDAGRLADVVAGKVQQADGALGGLPGGPGQFPRRLSVRRWFTGRYPEMWSVHSELHGGRGQGARRLGSHPAVVIEAPAGVGKTVLAEQYSLVFRDAYPGGVVWTSMAGADQVTGHFAAVVSEVARQRFGLDLSGMRPRQAKTTLAERITEDLLWVIDDVPEGLDPQTLNDLVVPSPKAHTLLTMRTAPPRWPGGAMTLTGLTTIEAEELIHAHRPDLAGDERESISGLVERCRGHPLKILSMMRRLRGAQGSDVLDDAGKSLVDSLVEVVRTRSPHAQLLLGFASVLARAPISGEMLVCGVSGLLGLQAPTLVAEALDELDEHGLLHRVAGTARQFWRLNSLVAAAASQDLVRISTSSFAEHAARILATRLGEASPDICTHALEVASNALVPLPVRLSLLHAVATRYEDRGDIPAARDTRDRALAISQGEWQFEDAEAAARLALAAGEAKAALRHTGMLVDRAEAERDVRSEFQARLIAATAHDVLGDYPKADAVFHQHALVREHGPTPVWLSEVDRNWVELARVRSLWLRGECRAAWQVTDAQETARRAISVFTDAGIMRHRLAREAVTVLTEAEVTMALPQMHGEPEQWAHATKRVRLALAESAEWYGPDSPLTLELMVLQGRTLVHNSEYGRALGFLAEAEQRTAAVFGDDHPLALRARQWTGLATMGRKDWKAAAAVFERLLPRQDAVLGREHPESQLTRFQLGTCLLNQNSLKRARPLLDEAVPVLRAHNGPLLQWMTTSLVGKARTRRTQGLTLFCRLRDIPGTGQGK